MTNVMTKNPLRVSNDNKTWPYLSLPVSQLDDVRRLLDRDGIRYTVSPNFLSFDDEPPVTIIRFGRDSDGVAIQAILDHAE
ncbi:MAG: hypothetical protein K8T89_18180 [Planctomycetes bacterium]|nr:hypothetical protein [Planctomycetota bacterium]